MGEQIRGIILEGQSCSGKTSLFNAIKRQFGLIDQAERTNIFMSEHYSQTLNNVHGIWWIYPEKKILKFFQIE
jgi:uridine kinase